MPKVRPVPKLSIVTTCYNHRQYLADSLASSLASSEEDIEVIFVDDASTDGSYIIASQMQAHDPRITIIRRRKNGGHAVALNDAISASHSPWLLKVDADDKIHPEYVASILQAAALMPELNVIFSPARLFGLENYDYHYRPFDPGQMIEHFMIPGPAGFKRELWRVVGGFDETMRYGEDWDFWVRAQLAVGLRVMQFKEPMWYYRMHDGPRVSRDGIKYVNELKRHMRSHTRKSVERQAYRMHKAAVTGGLFPNDD